MRRKSLWRLAVCVLAATFGCVAVVYYCAFSNATKHVPGGVTDSAASSRQTNVISDIAGLNLECARGLPGAEHINAATLLNQLDAWSAQIRFETKRHLYRFRQNPSEFDGSEAYYRMLMMAVVVAEDFGVRYNAALIGSPGTGSDQFFADSRDVFLHGLLSERRVGTCSSMPVLSVALGRRLGYPVFLVATKGHLFVRWEGRGERLNLEATGRGMNHYDDQHYREWPFLISDEEIAANGYLQSMTPAEELAAFLSIRGACLQENGRHQDAMEAFAQSARLVPQCLLYRQLAASRVPPTGGNRGPAMPDSGGIGVDEPGSSQAPTIVLDPNPLRTINQ